MSTRSPSDAATPVSPPYTLTEAQQTAIAGMARTLGRRPRRMPFTDRADFQHYWDRLAAACAQRRAESPAERRAREAAATARTVAYYTNEEHLLSYARHYCQRYQPSVAKLRSQLERKAGPGAPIAALLIRLGSLLDDDRRAREVVERLRAQGRNVRAIAAKLRQRQFTQETITRSLRAGSDHDGSLWDVDALQRKVRQLIRKGMASATIRRTLIERPADAPLVDAELAAQCGESGDAPAIVAAIARLRRRHLDDRAITRRLQAKGFAYADIAAALQASSTA